MQGNMNFSEGFKQSGQLCKFSPDNKYLASSNQYKLVIRDAKSLQIKALYSCLDTISYIEWSKDSMFVLCAMLKRTLIQVWSVDQPDWTCKIDEGSAGLVSVRWSPDSRHILSVSDFQLRVTIWSLISKDVSYIRYPKYSSQGLQFSNDGKFMALIERKNCKDFVSIYSCTNWHLANTFEPDTNDAADLLWSPSGGTLAIWESCLEYKVLIYAMDGRLISTFSAYDMALGIKSLSWSPSGQFLAIGSYDQVVRMLNNITWKPVVDYKHSPNLTSSSLVVYKEVESKPVVLPWESKAKGPFTSPSQYTVTPVPCQLPVIRPDPKKANPKVGVGLLAFSKDNRYLASRNDNTPHVVWIWNITKLALEVVLWQTQPVRAFEWDTSQCRLAVCSGTDKLYMWSQAGCLSVDVPCDTMSNLTHLQWSGDGSSIILCSRDYFCVCYLSVS